jgi:hypothetical protein
LNALAFYFSAQSNPPQPLASPAGTPQFFRTPGNTGLNPPFTNGTTRVRPGGDSFISVQAGGRSVAEFPRRPSGEDASFEQRDVNQPPRAYFISLGPYGVLRQGLFGIPMYLASLAAFIGTGIVGLWLWPRRFQRAQSVIVPRPGRLARLAAIGLLAQIGLGALGALLLIIVIGVPVAIAVAMLMSLVLLTGLVTAALAIGDWATRQLPVRWHSSLLIFGVGSLLLVPLAAIPYAGWATAILFGAIGCGAVVWTRFGGELALRPEV